MTDFQTFSQAIAARFAEMSKHELFVVDVGGEAGASGSDKEGF